MPPIRFLCVCSGISAPSAALKPRGWEPIAYAEIDPFASAVLAQRYGAGRPRFMPAPEEASDPKEASRRRNAIKALDGIEWGEMITNEGDFTRLRDEPMIVEADVLVGGTPCQAFSLAGLRRSLADDRGNLSLEFLRLADAIDDLRRDAGKPPVAILWENVPGVLSVADNAFGAFLAGMVGAQSPLVPPGKGGWTSSGVAAGQRRVAAWRSLDAQFFGLPQRRRRVFVLARGGAGALRVADALLPVIDSLCGHPAPSRQPREGAPGGAGASAGGSGGAAGGAERGRAGEAGGGGGPQGDGGRSVQRVAFGGNRTGGPIDVAAGLLAKPGSGIRQDFESDTFVVEEPMPFGLVQLKDVADEITASEAKGHSVVMVEAFDSKASDIAASGDLAPTLRSMNFHGSHPNGGGQIAVAFSMRGRDGENVIEPEGGGVAPALRTGGGGSDEPFVAVAFREQRRPGGTSAEWSADQSFALTAPDGGGRTDDRLIAVAFKPSHYTRDKDGAPSELSPALSADADKGDQDPLILQEEAKAFTVSGQANGWESDVNPALLAHPQSDKSNLQYGVRVGTAVRRLTPRECERLQGFADDFTLIAYSDAHRSPEDEAETIAYLQAFGYGENEARALAATPDGPRYRALGNSQAVAVISELGARIEWLLAEGGW